LAAFAVGVPEVAGQVDVLPAERGEMRKQGIRHALSAAAQASSAPPYATPAFLFRSAGQAESNETSP